MYETKEEALGIMYETKEEALGILLYETRKHSEFSEFSFTTPWDSYTKGDSRLR